MAAKKRARRPRNPDTTTLGAAGLDQFASELGRLNSTQQDQYDFLKQIQLPGPVGNRLRLMARQMADGLRAWPHVNFAKQKYRETTGRRGVTGPDGRTAILNRPVDHRRITDTTRREMLRCPPIVMALGARISPVVGAFSSWAPESNDAIQRALLKVQLEGMLHQLVGDMLGHSLKYGFAPFELVWENGVDLELEVVEGDDEDLVFDDPSQREFATKSGGPTKTDPAAAQVVVKPKPRPKPKIVQFPGATVLRKAKDLHPSYTDILVEGPLSNFAGLRYESDKNQELDPLQSLVVTHDGPFGQMYGNAALDSIYEPFYILKIVTVLCNMYLERKGDPPYKGFAPLVGTYDENGNVIHGYEVMTDAIPAMRGSGGVVLPSDTDEKGNRKYDLETMNEDPRVEIFVRWIEHMIRMMLWGLLVPDGAVWQSSRVGSFAASQTYADLAVNLREIDLRGIEGFLNRYVVGRILAMNFANPKPASIRAKTRPDVKVALIKEFMLKAMDPKTEVGQTIASMIDAGDAFKQVGVPTL